MSLAGEVTVMESCTNAVAGLVVVRDSRLLLIERRKPPYAWAPPAGHVDPGETFKQAAERELFEEVGLRANELNLRLSQRYDTWCRRPGENWHHWEVFEATAEGEPSRSESETCAMRWVTGAELAELTELTKSHLRAGAGPEVWRARPGLEPVWVEILNALDIGETLQLAARERRVRRGSQGDPS